MRAYSFSLYFYGPTTFTEKSLSQNKVNLSAFLAKIWLKMLNGDAIKIYKIRESQKLYAIMVNFLASHTQMYNFVDLKM